AGKVATTVGGGLGPWQSPDEPQAIEKKIKSAVTDSGSEIRRAPEKPGVSNLIEMLAAVRGAEPAAVEAEFAHAGYGEFKAAVAVAVVDYLAPLRGRYEQLRDGPDELEAILADGAARARAIASETLLGVRERMGVGAPRRTGAVR